MLQNVKSHPQNGWPEERALGQGDSRRLLEDRGVQARRYSERQITKLIE